MREQAHGQAELARGTRRAGKRKHTADHSDASPLYLFDEPRRDCILETPGPGGLWGLSFPVRGLDYRRVSGSSQARSVRIRTRGETRA